MSRVLAEAEENINIAVVEMHKPHVYTIQVN
jgi:hypothetical protein